MKLKRYENFLIEEFSDGEVVLYDISTEVYHILNQSAAYALHIVENHDYADAKRLYVEWAKGTFTDFQDAKPSDDFDVLIEDLIHKNILYYR